jgi:hypothetical protein
MKWREREREKKKTRHPRVGVFDVRKKKTEEAFDSRTWKLWIRLG